MGDMTQLWRAGDQVDHVDVNRWQRLGHTLDDIRNYFSLTVYGAKINENPKYLTRDDEVGPAVVRQTDTIDEEKKGVEV